MPAIEAAMEAGTKQSGKRGSRHARRLTPGRMALTLVRAIAVVIVFFAAFYFVGRLPMTGVNMNSQVTSDVTYANGTTAHFDSNRFGNVDKGDVVTVHLMLPEEPVVDSPVLTFYIYHSVTDIKFGDELLDSYGADIDAKGDMVGENVFMTPIPADAWGHEVTITLRATEDAAFTQVRSLKLYPEKEAYRYYFEVNPIGFVVAFPLLFLGILFFITFAVGGNYNRDSKKAMCIGAFSVIAATWIISSMGAQRLAGLDSYGWTLLDFVSIFLVIVPIVLYAYESEERGAIHVILGVTAGTVLVYFIVSTVLDVTNVMHYSSTLLVSHLLTFVGVAVLLVYAVRRKLTNASPNTNSDSLFLDGLLIICFSGLYDLMSFNFRKFFGYVGVETVQSVLPLGMLFFIIFLLRSYGLDIVAQQTKAAEADNLSKIISRTPAGICVLKTDENLSIVEANDVFYDIVGIKPYQNRPQNALYLTDVLNATGRADINNIRQLLEGGTKSEIELPIKVKDGPELTVLAKLSYDKDDSTVTLGLVDITARKAMEDQLRMSEERYRLALDQSGKAFFYFDVPTRTARLSDELASQFGVDVNVSDIPDGILRTGLVEQESVEAFRDLFQQIVDGKSPGEAIIACHSAEDRETTRWLKLNFTSIFDAENRPTSAIITYDDVSDQHRIDIESKWTRSSLASLPLNSYAIEEFDLTDNALLSHQGALVDIRPAKGDSYDETVSKVIDGSVLEEDRDRCREFLSRERLLDLFARGITAASEEYRLTSEGSPGFRWAGLSLQMIADPYSSHTLLQIVTRDVSQVKTKQFDLERAAHYDALTKLLRRGAAQEQILAHLKESAGVDALVLMDVDRFKQVNDTYGHPFADTVLHDIAATLTSSLRSSDIVSRWGGDEMLIFLKDVGTEENAKRILSKASKAIAERMAVKTERGEITCSFGGAIYPSDATCFDDLYQRADTALYSAKQKRNQTIWSGQA